MRRFVDEVHAGGCSGQAVEAKLEKVSLSKRQFSVGVSGAAEHTGPRYNMFHQTGHWLIVDDYFNAFNTVERAVFLKQVAKCVPAFTPFVANFYAGKSAKVFFQMNAGDRGND